MRHPTEEELAERREYLAPPVRWGPPLSALECNTDNLIRGETVLDPCRAFRSHAWGPWVKEWDGERRGVVEVATCARSRCGARRLKRHHGHDMVKVNRGRRVPRGFNRRTR